LKIFMKKIVGLFKFLLDKLVYLIKIIAGIFKFLLDKLDYLQIAVITLLMGASTFIAVYEVFMRYVLRSSTVWAEEFNRYILVWLALIGFSLVYKYNNHVQMTFFYRFFRGIAGKIVVVLNRLIFMLFGLLLTYISYEFFASTLDLGLRSSTPLRFPLWLPHLAIFVGALLLFIRGGEMLVLEFTTPVEAKTEEQEEEARTEEKVVDM